MPVKQLLLRIGECDVLADRFVFDLVQVALEICVIVDVISPGVEGELLRAVVGVDWWRRRWRLLCVGLCVS